MYQWVVYIKGSTLRQKTLLSGTDLIANGRLGPASLMYFSQSSFGLKHATWPGLTTNTCTTRSHEVVEDILSSYIYHPLPCQPQGVYWAVRSTREYVQMDDASKANHVAVKPEQGRQCVIHCDTLFSRKPCEIPQPLATKYRVKVVQILNTGSWVLWSVPSWNHSILHWRHFGMFIWVNWLIPHSISIYWPWYYSYTNI